MPLRLLSLFLLLPWCVLAQKNIEDNPHKHSYHPRFNGGFGFEGGSLNFQQNGNLGFAFHFDYDLIQGKRSSLSISQGITFGSSDQYGISFPPEVVVLFALALVDYSGGNLDLSDNHRVADYADFPLLLHYNFGAGASRRLSENKMGFYLGGGFTHTFLGYTNTFDKAAQTDYWAWVADGGIRFRANYGGAFSIGLGVEQPLRSPIGPIHNPIFYQLNLIWSAKP